MISTAHYATGATNQQVADPWQTPSPMPSPLARVVRILVELGEAALKAQAQLRAAELEVYIQEFPFCDAEDMS